MKQEKFEQTEIGMIPEDWEEISFSEAVEVNPKRELRKGSIAKCVSMANIQPLTKRIFNYTLREFKGGSKFRNGDTLFARITPSLENGKTAFVDILSDDEIGFGSTEFIVLGPKEGKTNPHFVYYLSRSPEVRSIAIKSMTGTSGRQRVENDVFDRIVTYLPPLKEQSAIVNILSNLDSKITLNLQMNETLEEIGKAIFKYWFVDFEFPNKNGRAFKSSGGKMVYNEELGREIPKEYRVGKLGDLVQITTGQGLRRDEFRENGQYSILGANGELGKTDKYLFDEKLILTGRVGTLGTVYLANGKCWISDNVLISKPKKEENYYYALFVLRKLNFQSLNRGSTQPLITQTDLKNQQVMLPNEILSIFHKIIKNLFEKIELNEYEIKTLSLIRDSFLPKLMSSKIRVLVEARK